MTDDNMTDESAEDYGYTLARRPAWTAEVAQAIEVHRRWRLFKALQLHEPTVWFATSFGGGGDHLARHVAETGARNVIALNVPAITRMGKGTDDVFQVIHETLLHEYAHAYIESALVDDERPDNEEDICEEFVRLVFMEDVTDAVAFLKAAVDELLTT